MAFGHAGRTPGRSQNAQNRFKSENGSREPVWDRFGPFHYHHFVLTPVQTPLPQCKHSVC
eukprot:1918876-Prymnesium_polylepis.1